MNTRKMTQSRKLSTSSAPLSSLLKQRRQAKSYAKANKNRAINQSTHYNRYWTAKED